MLGKIHDFIKSQGYDFEVQTLNSKWQGATDKAGHKVWYIGTDHGDDLTTFTFGDFRDPDKRFTFKTKASLTAIEQAKLEKFDKRVALDKSLKQALSKNVVQGLLSDWSQLDLGKDNADYLIKKGLPRPAGVIVRDSTEDKQKILVIPMQDPSGETWNIQQIFAGGDKTFHPGARVKGAFYTFGAGLPGTPILIGEGFATCQAAHLATGLNVVCAFNISNLEAAIRSLMDKGVGAHDIVLLADWDGGTFKRTGKNPGMLAVQKLTRIYKVGWGSPVATHWPGLEENLDFADLWAAPGGPDMIRAGISDVKFYEALTDFEFQRAKPVTESVSETPETGGLDAQTSKNAQICEETAPEFDQIYPELDNSAQNPVTEMLGLGDTAAPLQVTHIGPTWVPVVHKINTRNTGFHEVQLTGKSVKHEPVYTDLRAAFEEQHPFVTHEASEVVYAFTGKKYEMVSELKMASFAEQHFDPKPKNNTVREFIGSVTRYNVKGDEFFACEKKINFANGWLDLKTMEFRPHGPQVGFKHVLGYDFDPVAVCPEWDAFLGRVLCEDPVLMQMLMEYLGYILSGDECWAQKALVLKGEGSNGKSTLLKIVRALIGSQNLSSAKVSEFKSEYSRQLLDGKLANISEETPKDALLDSSIFKDIVSGGTIQVRAIYGTPYSLDVRAKLLFSCNDMPPTGDNSWALLRRLLIVPFNALFTEQSADPFIDRKLSKELSGIFNKALLAYFELLKRGRFEVSGAVHNAVKEYQKSTNPVISWLEEKITVHDVNSAQGKVVSSVSSLFTDFKMYCDASGFKLMNVENFAKQLRRALPEADQRAGMFGKNTDRFRGFLGVTTRDGQAVIDSRRTGLEF